jgi:enoyl-CoA hydratase
MGRIEVTQRERVAIVTMNAAPVNGLTPEFARELDAVRVQLRADANVGAVVLASGNPATFCAGADASWVAERSAAIGVEAFTGEFERFTGELTTLAHAIYDGPQVWIAAIDGHCVAGGLELALACDIRIAAAEGVRFALPELGMFGAAPTGAGALQVLVRVAGRSRALMLVATGAAFAPIDALAWRIVDELAPHGGVLDRASAVAELIARPAVAGAIAGVKEALRASDVPLDEARRRDRDIFVKQLHAGPFADGLAQFAQRFGSGVKGTK